MNLLTILLFLTSSLLVAAYIGGAQDGKPRTRCWSSGNKQAARWWNEGEQVDRGKYWYECRNGQLEPRGCFSNTGERLNIGDTFNHDGYVNSCILANDGYLEFKYTGCVAEDGQVKKPGDTWNDPKEQYVFKCDDNGKFVRTKVEGCLTHDKSRTVGLGEKYDQGDYTYECQQKFDGVIQMCSVGCVHEGQRYKIGQQWPEGDFLFYCKSNGGRCQKKCIGCVYQNKNLFDGDRYRKEQSIYQCEIRQKSYGHKPVGCISKELDGSTIDRVIGCRWYLTTLESKIEQTCVLEGANTKINTVGCIYRYKGFDTLYLEPGTYTIWNLPSEKKGLGLACKKTSEAAELVKFEVNDLASQTSGLTYMQPKGK